MTTTTLETNPEAAVAGIVAREAARAAERDTTRQRQQSARQLESNVQKVAKTKAKADRQGAQKLARQQKAEERANRLRLAQALLEPREQSGRRRGPTQVRATNIAPTRTPPPRDTSPVQELGQEDDTGDKDTDEHGKEGGGLV